MTIIADGAFQNQSSPPPIFMAIITREKPETTPKKVAISIENPAS